MTAPSRCEQDTAYHSSRKAAEADLSNRFGIIVDVEGIHANLAHETTAAETMSARVMRRFGIRPDRLAGDTAYGTGRLLKWLVDRDITPHVPVIDKSPRKDGRFSKADFKFDPTRSHF